MNFLGVGVWLLVFLLPVLIARLAVPRELDLTSLGLMAVLAALTLWSLRASRIQLSRIEKRFCYLVFITGFFGVALFSIDIGPFTLFPYRIFLLFLWALFIIRALLQGKFRLPIRRITPYLLFLSVWVGYALISLGWAMSKGAALRHLIFLFMGASTIFFAVVYFQEMQDLKRIYWIWFLIFGGMLLLGVWEHLTGQHLPVSGLYGETQPRLMFRPTGVFHNPNDYATYLALSIPFGLALSRYARKVSVRLAALGTAVVAFYLILVTGSRANILAVILEGGFLTLLLTNAKQKVKYAVAATLCLAMVWFLFPGPVEKLVSQVMGELSSIVVQAELGVGSVAIRVNIARNGLAFLSSTAGFGVGAGNAEYWMANFAKYDTSGILNLHNWWLEILINYGIFIFAGYLLFYGGLVWGLWRSWRCSIQRDVRMINEALLLAAVGFLFASLSSSSIMAFKPQWFLFAYALAFLNWRRSQPKEAR